MGWDNVYKRKVKSTIFYVVLDPLPTDLPTCKWNFQKDLNF